MKVEAYECDYCNSILKSEYVTGIVNETDLFQRDNFITVEPKKSDCHFCMECYRVNVLMNVQNKMNWKDGEKYSKEREDLKRQLTNDYAKLFKGETRRRFILKNKKK